MSESDRYHCARHFDVSVVISTRNRCDLLRRALIRLLDQDCPAGLTYEIIVVDNNSSDGTADLVTRLVADSSGRVRYLHEPNEGVSHGRNAGIRASLAPVVAFTDDDNVVDRRWVATVKKLMDRYPDASAVGGKVLPEWSTAVPAWLNRQHWSPLAALDYGTEPFYTSARDPRCLLTANLAFRRTVFESIGGFSPRLRRCQDHELLIRLWRAGRTALYSPDLIVYAPVAPERLTRRYHRAWHSRHGRYAALMRGEELCHVTGQLRATDFDGARLLGVPRHVYAELCRALFRLIVATFRREPSLRLRWGYHARYLRAYIAQTMLEHSRRRAHRAFEALVLSRRRLGRAQHQ
jgi:glycosyltransferase involved in cell wall biosynthesis